MSTKEFDTCIHQALWPDLYRIACFQANKRPYHEAQEAHYHLLNAQHFYQEEKKRFAIDLKKSLQKTAAKN